jgi:ferredoxin
VTVSEVSGERRTLLDIAKLNGVPILFTCETGDCSACIVNVESRSPDTAGFAPLTEKERFLLEAMFFLTAADVKAAEAGERAPDVRLACQYRPGPGEDILVTFETGF